MRPNVHRHYAIVLDIKHDAQIVLHVGCVNRPSIIRREPLDFVGAKAWVKRILFEDLPSAARRILSAGWQIVETFPETLGWLEPITHLAPRRDGGGAPPDWIQYRDVLHWKAKYGGLEVSETRRLRQLEDENGRLKKIVAQQALDIDALKMVLSKKW